MSRGASLYTVATGEAGWRLDTFLAASLGASRAQVRRELERGRVRVDGRPVGLAAKGMRVEAGVAVEVEAWTPPARRTPIPEPGAPLRVLAEGPGWVAVDKPAGVPVHPLQSDETGSVLGALVARHPEMVGVGEGGLRSGVVHRLDVDTSGVLLFATDEARFEQLRGAFRRHRMRKTYRALVAGRLPDEGDVVLHLAVGRHRPARVRAVEPDDPEFGRRTRRTALRFRALVAFEDATLVEVRPETGFLHQIRVTLAHLGHPVLGDRTYGPPPAPDALPVPRQMLHASHIAWGDVEASSPDPPDLVEALEQRGGAARARPG